MRRRQRKLGTRRPGMRLHYVVSILQVLALVVACRDEPGRPGPVAAVETSAPIVPAATNASNLPVTPLPPEVTTPDPGIPPEMEHFLRQTRPEELAKRAELIVLGSTVAPQTTGRVPPGSPLAPPEPPGEPAHEAAIYTETQVEVERVLKGTSPGSTVRVRTLGGMVDGLAMAMTHEPQLKVGQRVVLFLRQIEPKYYTPLGEDGVYEIMGEAASGARHRFQLQELLAHIEDSAR